MSSALSLRVWCISTNAILLASAKALIFPEHLEFRYYITPERKACFELYSKTLEQRRTFLEKTQDLGQCLIDLYDTDFYDAYCSLSEINSW